MRKSEVCLVRFEDAPIGEDRGSVQPPVASHGTAKSKIAGKIGALVTAAVQKENEGNGCSCDKEQKATAHASLFRGLALAQSQRHLFVTEFDSVLCPGGVLVSWSNCVSSVCFRSVV